MSDTRQFRYRPTISKKWTATRVISAQDSLDMDKIMFSANKEGHDSVVAYLDYDEVLLISTCIMNGRFAEVWPVDEEYAGISVKGKYFKYGGSTKTNKYGGAPESRVLEVAAGIQDGEAKWSITISNGEGVSKGKGLISPKNRKNMVTQRVYFSQVEIMKFFINIETHIGAYYGKYFSEFYDTKGEKGNRRKKDVFSSEDKHYGDTYKIEGGEQSGGSPKL